MAPRVVTAATIMLGSALLSCSALAQDRPAELVGTYDGSQIEVATELRLEASGRFEYYLSYGALDEVAQGSWAVDADGLVLTSDPVKEPAFELVDTQTGTGDTLVIALDVPANLPKELFSVFVLRPDATVQEVNFGEGPLQLSMRPDNRPRKIAVALSLFQVASQPFDIAPGTRAMHVRFAPNDLGKVAFKDQRLPHEGDAFVLERFDRILRYVKERPEQSGSGAARN